MAINMSDPALLAYLEGAAAVAATQDLTQDVRAATINLSVAFVSIAFVFLILRFYSRQKQMTGYGMDDWLIILAFLFLGANLAAVVASKFFDSSSLDRELMVLVVNHGHLGLHSGALTLDQAIYLGKVSTE
jgi:hypothetical protein